jgi:hypothetical protein
MGLLLNDLLVGPVDDTSRPPEPPIVWFPARVRRPLLVLVAAAAALTATGAEAATTATVRFTDATTSAGLTSATAASDPLKGAYVHAAAWGDVEGDGDADLFVGTFTDAATTYYAAWGATAAAPNQLFLNDGSGRFSRSNQPALAVYGRAAGAVFADLDNDGDDDLVVSNNSKSGATVSARAAEPNHLYRNDRGTFTDVSSSSGIRPSAFLGGRAIGVLDYDGDGCLDLFLVADGLAGYTGTSRLLKGSCRLTFTDVTTAAGVATAQGDKVQGLGVAVGDVDGDGWPDVFVAGGPPTEPRRGFLFRNRGNGTFTEVSAGTMFDIPAAASGAREDWTSSASFGDLNRDGKLDLVVEHHFDSGRAGTAIKPTIYLNRTTGTSVSFRNVTTASGVVGVAAKTPHVEIADIDNDGWPDLYVSVLLGTSRQPMVYRHTGTLTADGTPTFRSPSDRSAPDYYPGGPLVDVNRDGLLEPFLEEYEPTRVPTLLRNASTATGGWLDVVTGGTRNTDGIGATVRVYSGSGTTRTLLATMPVQVGNGFSSASLPVVHVGLGSARTVEVEVTPPGGGTVKRMTGVAANRRVRVTL